MPAKTTASPQKNNEQAARENLNWVFKWLFILGGVVAGVANMLALQNEFLISALMLVGVLVGLFYFDSNEVINIGLRYLIFTAVANSVGGFYMVGSYFNGFLTGFAYYLGPVVLTVVIVYFVKRYILNKS
jgi:hypothetical protein